MKQVLFLFSALFLFACNNDDDNNDGPTNPDPDPQTSEYFMKADVDGSNVNLQENDDYKGVISNTGSVDASGEGPATCYNDYGGGISHFDAPSDNPSLSLNFIEHIVVVGCEDEELFVDSFEIGDYFYASGSNSGVAINYYDGDNSFSSLFGDQSESTFTLESKEQISTTPTGEIVMKISGTFSCTVYDLFGSGESKVLENGSFTLQIQSKQ